LRNCKKQHLILAKFYTNHVPFIRNQTAQTSVESDKANDSYSAFCEVTPKHFSFGSLCLTSSTKIWNWSVLGWPHKRHCNYGLR